ncbi:MAG: hypothetical protein AAF311_03685 [Pseudomonadota bacterium]
MTDDELVEALGELGHHVVSIVYGTCNCQAVDLTYYQILDPREHPDFKGSITPYLIDLFGGT